ncbi:putative secreted protein [Pusillimonas sp. T7-7]|nr:putative secreted protein [Pusillimonas sp. T7-7]
MCLFGGVVLQCVVKFLSSVGFVHAAVLLRCAGLACLLLGQPAQADSQRLRELAPVQLFAAPQIEVAPPVPLPDAGATPVVNDEETIFTDAADSIPDISYSFSWSPGDSDIWHGSDVSPSSPGLWGALSTPRGRQFTPSSAGRGTSWALGAKNWSYKGDDGLDIALGSKDIVAPAWGNSARLGGISISQSSLVNAEDVENNWQYALSIGALDYSSGSGGDLELGPTAANSVFRYGISPSFVLESQLQVAPELVSTGLGGQYRTSWGNWSAGLAQATVGDQGGLRYQAAYELDVFGDLRLSWLGEHREPGYADLSRYTADPSVGGQRQQWTATVPMGRWGDLSGRYENEQTSLGDSRRSFGFTQQFWYSPNLRIGLEAERQLDGGDYDIGIRFSVPIY